MDISIRYRCDEEDHYCEDVTIMRGVTWREVFIEVGSIQSHATVLEIIRLDIN